jgi:hypothetical protein
MASETRQGIQEPLHAAGGGVADEAYADAEEERKRRTRYCGKRERAACARAAREERRRGNELGRVDQKMEDLGSGEEDGVAL